MTPFLSPRLEVRHANIFQIANPAPIVLLLHFCSSIFTFIDLCNQSMRSELLDAGRRRTSHLNIHYDPHCQEMLEYVGAFISFFTARS